MQFALTMQPTIRALIWPNETDARVEFEAVSNRFRTANTHHNVLDSSIAKIDRCNAPAHPMKHRDRHRSCANRPKRRSTHAAVVFSNRDDFSILAATTAH